MLCHTELEHSAHMAMRLLCWRDGKICCNQHVSPNKLFVPLSIACSSGSQRAKHNAYLCLVSCQLQLTHVSCNIMWHIFLRCHHQDVGCAGGTTRSSSVAVERRLQREIQLSSPTPSWGLAQTSCARQLPKRLAGARSGSTLMRQNACYMLSQSLQAM